MIPVSKIIYAINILTEKVLEMYQNFRNKKRPFSIKYIQILNDTVCLVHMLLYLFQDLNFTNRTYYQTEMLIDDYEDCRKIYYQIKGYINTLNKDTMANDS